MRKARDPHPTMANYALRLSESLFDDAREVAGQENVSMNQFFVTAIAEKVSTRKAAGYFRRRATNADPAAIEAWLRHSPDTEPVAGDELPD